MYGQIETAAQAQWVAHELENADAAIKELHAIFPRADDAHAAKKAADQYRFFLVQLAKTWAYGCCEEGHRADDECERESFDDAHPSHPDAASFGGAL